MGKNPLPVQETLETWVRSLGGEDPLEEGMATHASVLAWRIAWTEEPGGLQSLGSQRVGHDLETTKQQEELRRKGCVSLKWLNRREYVHNFLRFVRDPHNSSCFITPK